MITFRISDTIIEAIHNNKVVKTCSFNMFEDRDENDNAVFALLSKVLGSETAYDIFCGEYFFTSKKETIEKIVSTAKAEGFEVVSTKHNYKA